MKRIAYKMVWMVSVLVMLLISNSLLFAQSTEETTTIIQSDQNSIDTQQENNDPQSQASVTELFLYLNHILPLDLVNSESNGSDNIYLNNNGTTIYGPVAVSGSNFYDMNTTIPISSTSSVRLELFDKNSGRSLGKVSFSFNTLKKIIDKGERYYTFSHKWYSSATWKYKLNYEVKSTDDSSDASSIPLVVDAIPLASDASSFRVSISGPTNLLLQGQTVTITGKVTDSSGKPLKNEILGVNDGLTLLCSQTTTDSNGRINYTATVNAAGTAVVEFVVRDYRYPFVFQAAKKSGNELLTNPLYLTAFTIQNKSSQDIKATTTVDNGTQYTHKVSQKRTTTILKTATNQAMKRVTVFKGETFSVGLGALGGNTSVTVNSSGVGTISFTGGTGIVYRGKVYATTESAVGACWAPGGDLGTTPVSLSGGVALCAGTDGVSVSVIGSSGGSTVGFKIQIY